MAHDNAPTLDDVLASALARRESQGILRRLTTRARNLVDFSSNDYLSLSQNPDVRSTYLSCLGAPGANGNAGFALGSGGSRLLDGNSAMAEALERNLADFHGAPAGLLFNSGFEANTGLFACVPQAGDVVIFDDLVHASVHSGIKLSRASQRLPFKHNSVWKQEGAQLEAQNPIPDALGGTMSLDAVLYGLVEGEGGRELREGRKHVFIAVEAIYSMDGDLAPLEDIVRCVENRLPMRNGHVIVDEAHSNGLLGDRGQGLVCHLGLEDRVWARVHTFGKALGCSGAVVLCSAVTREYLINYARTFIYTTATGFPGLLSIQVAYQFVSSGRADVFRHKLQGLMQHTRTRLAELCCRRSHPAGLVRVSPGSVQSPIVPIFTTRARSLADHCQRRGYLVRAIVAPTVPKGTDRVRLCLHAGNSIEECDGLCTAIEEWVSLQTEAGGGTTSPTVERWPTRQIKHRL